MTTIDEIEACFTELKGAMLESMEASRAEVDAKLRKQKAHYRLLKAKEVLRAIEF